MAYMFDVFSLIVIVSGLMALGGFVVYFGLFMLFKKRFGEKITYHDPVKEDIVMCGEEPPSEEFIVPITRVFVDVMTRAFRRAFKTIMETAGSNIVQDWFFYMLLVLIALIIISILVG